MKLDVWTKLNGDYEQRGNTSDMLFGISEMLAYFSSHMRCFPATSWRRARRPASDSARNHYMAVG